MLVSILSEKVISDLTFLSYSLHFISRGSAPVEQNILVLLTRKEKNKRKTKAKIMVHEHPKDWRKDSRFKIFLMIMIMSLTT